MPPENALVCFAARLLRLSCLLLLPLFALPAVAQIVHLELSERISATAELMPGEEEGKSILILHGFLQTREFATVRRLATALHDEGHTVLLPTLSLGINHRKQSLACEAIHTHSMRQDIDEISRWINWLSKQTNDKVTLIGHSIGSLLLLAYLDRTPMAPVDEVLLISLIAFTQGPIAKETAQDRLKAMEQLEIGDHSLTAYPLAFCDNYVSTPENYLSYMDWNVERSLATLAGLDIQTTIIMGKNDIRLGSDWLPQLRKAGVKIIEIEGANHFFNHEYEFDLSDTITKILE